MRPRSLQLERPLVLCLALVGCSEPAIAPPDPPDVCGGHENCVVFGLSSPELDEPLAFAELALQFPHRDQATTERSYYFRADLGAKLPFDIGITFDDGFDARQRLKDLFLDGLVWVQTSVAVYDASGQLLGVANGQNSCDVQNFCVSSFFYQHLHRLSTPSCDDSAWDGDETGIDCGGSCRPCAVGQGCNDNHDCQARSECLNNRCVALPDPCQNGVRDGDESDVDCGGSCSQKCADRSACLTDQDCGSQVCWQSVCLSGGECWDGKRSAGETNVDCGGICEGCAGGDPCLSPFDCASLFCINGMCQAPSCSDHIKNGDESDVDCGGPSCPHCENGKLGKAGDCQSGYAQYRVYLHVPTYCAPLLCNNGQKDVGEADRDCGGVCPAGCYTGWSCQKASDCESNVCTNGKCAPPACNDHVQNGDESDVDCGGDCLGCGLGQKCWWAHLNACAPGLECDKDAMICVPDTCMSCGAGCVPCPVFTPCQFGADCASQICQMGRCQSPTCSDGVKNGLESDADCGGNCASCGSGKACSNNFDCASGQCVGSSRVDLQACKLEYSIVSPK